MTLKPIKTNWVVFTGTSCTGKTTLLETLAERGRTIVPEASRTYYDAQRGRGMPDAEIRADEAAFQRAILDQKLEIEANLDPGELVFMDRALPDSISYYQNAGLDPEPIHPLCSRFRYKAVFLFDPLPMEDDPARTETAAQRAQLQSWLWADYRDLGYAPIRIPVGSIEDRLTWILDKSIGPAQQS